MEPDSLASRTRRIHLAALCLIVIAGLCLRMTGIGFLLPQLPEPDGVVIDQQVHRMRADDRLEGPPFIAAFYPTLVAHVAALMPQPGALPATTLTVEQHLQRASSYRTNIRIVVALMSLLAVVGTWWLARRFMPDAWASIAALLLATSVFHVWFSQEARPHAAETSFALLAVVASLRLRERGGWSAYAIAGFAAALAVGCLQNGLAVLPALLVAVVLRLRARRRALRSGATGTAEPLRRIVLGSVLALVLVGAAVRLFYPFVFDAPKRAGIGTQGSTFELSGHRIDLSMFNGRGFATVLRSLWEYDPLIASACMLGALVAFVTMWRARKTLWNRDEIWIVLAFVVPYAIAIGLYQRTYQRFALPLVPFECALAAYGLWRAASAAKNAGRVVHASAIAAITVLLAVQSFAAFELVRARSRPDTLTSAARWIESTVPRDDEIAMIPGIDLPLLQSVAARNANFPLMNDLSYPWFDYQWRLSEREIADRGWNLHSLPLVTQGMRDAARNDLDGFVRARAAKWIVLEVYTPDRRPFPAALRAAVAARGELVARISPDAKDTGENLPIVYQDDEFPYTTPWFERILRARCVGPVIEIYRMR
jgi:hypothetical protein